MSDFTPDLLDADDDLYRVANTAIVALRRDLERRAKRSGDPTCLVKFGAQALRLGTTVIAKASTYETAAEHAYRAADALVAAAYEERRP